MGFQADIAQAILDTLKTCVDCENYDRQLISLGDPTIECSMLAVGLLGFPPMAQVADCAIYELRMNVVIARCCYPTGDSLGNPPLANEISRITRCVADDIELILCCLQNVSFDIPGAVRQCKPKIFNTTYSRPQGLCVAAKIDIRLPGVPCCVIP